LRVAANWRTSATGAPQKFPGVKFLGFGEVFHGKPFPPDFGHPRVNGFRCKSRFCGFYKNSPVNWETEFAVEGRGQFESVVESKSNP
jgi:hypothetical protein